MSQPTIHHAPDLSDEQIDRMLDAMADSFGQQLRSPIMHSPSEQGLVYQDVTFPSLDGVPLEGWFVPAPGWDKLIIANPAMGFSRSGIPAHLEPWRSVWRSSGNDFGVNLVPDLKILHDAGYNVLAYDLRNFGHSGAANGGMASSGIFEARDVLGSLKYGRLREGRTRGRWPSACSAAVWGAVRPSTPWSRIPRRSTACDAFSVPGRSP